MKSIYLLTASLGILLSSFLLKSDSPGIKLGDKAPMFSSSLKDINGRSLSLEQIKKNNGLLVVFSCNTCPFVIAWEDRYNDLHELAIKNNVGMALINSNEAKRSGDDSPAAMKTHATEQKYTMPYLIDDKHKMADAFGARTTPHVYLFNKDAKLVYVGAIDDNSKEKNAVKSPYLKTAIQELGNGKSQCSTSETKAVGCSIKRVL